MVKFLLLWEIYNIYVICVWVYNILWIFVYSVWVVDWYLDVGEGFWKWDLNIWFCMYVIDRVIINRFDFGLCIVYRERWFYF